MKRLVLSAAVATISVCVARDAAAFEFGTPPRQHPYRSSQDFCLELRFSPYYPQVDDEPGLKPDPTTGQLPFAESFGDKARFYIGLEFDWQVWRIPYIGTIGPGLGVGTVTMSRNATTVSGRPSGDEYSLTIYPFYLSGVLRADGLWYERGFPLVPYGKLGLGYGLWRASNTGGTASADGVSAKGATWGTHAALGISFALDAIDTGATRNMDNAIGINNTYIYIEYYWLNLNGIGQTHALHVGSNSWAAGLAFEF
jgi:hypothetical protein